MIRHELCEEAIRLGLLLDEHPVGAAPETAALLALMYLDAARFDSRVDGAGGLLLLEEQDRSLWDRDLIHAGISYLHRAARGEVFSRYHAEAGDRRRALSRADLRRDSLGRDRAPLSDARGRRSVAHQYVESRRSPSPSGKAPTRGSLCSRRSSPHPGSSVTTSGTRHSASFTAAAGIASARAAHLTRALDAAPTHAEKALLRRRLEACR